MLEDLKEEVCQANLDLVRHGLVILTFGNVSGIDRAAGLVVIKPSGVSYEGMTAEDIVLVDLDGRPVRRQAAAVLGHAHAPGPLPGLSRDRRRRPRPQRRRHGLRPGPAGDPLPRHDPRRPLQRARPRHPLPDGQGSPRPDTRCNTGRVIVERFAGLRPAGHAGRARRRARPLHLGTDAGRGRPERPRPGERRGHGPDDPGHRSPDPAAARATSSANTTCANTDRRPITDKKRRPHEQRPDRQARPRRRQPRLLPHRAVPEAPHPGGRGMPQEIDFDRRNPDRRREREGRPQGPRRDQGRRASTPWSSTWATSAPKGRRRSWPSASTARSCSPPPPRRPART